MQRGNQSLVPSLARSRLFHKYAALLFSVVALSVVLTGSLHTWFSYHELKSLLLLTQGEQAKSAAGKISQFVKEIEGQLAWATQLPLHAKTADEWRFDSVRLFRQAPAITEIAQLNSLGRERFRSSRQAMDVIGSMTDLSGEIAFTKALTNKILLRSGLLRSRIRTLHDRSRYRRPARSRNRYRASQSQVHMGRRFPD